MVNLSRLFYKATGLMPRKEIVRTSQNIGKQLAKECEQGDTTSVKRVSELLTEVIGKKKAKKIVITDDFETFKQYTASLGLDEKTAKLYFEGSKSAVLSNSNDKSVLLSLRINRMSRREAINTIAHELEHTLFKTLSPRAKLEQYYIKLRGKKWMNNYVQKYGQLINEKAFWLQQKLLMNSKLGTDALSGKTQFPLSKQGLLSQMDIQSERELNNILKSAITQSDEMPPKTKLKVLKSFRAILKDESRAYKAGGAAERFYDSLIGASSTNANKSEMMALLYDETRKAVNREIKQVRKNRIKSFLGIKPKNKNFPGFTKNPDGSITCYIGGKKVRTGPEQEIQASEVPDNIKDLLDK